ncbi:MAG: VOC family protein [Nitrospinae bacterium]|nr:VOC family protein [Nitrospinota bacterium]
MQKIVPCLWFKGNAEEAVNFYASIFKDSKVVSMSRYGESGSKVSKMPKGSVMTISFQLNGQEFLAMNSEPDFPFTPAISFMVHCQTQAEVDYYWDKLADGGEYQQCGWLTDKFGLFWQIVPVEIEKILSGDNPAKSDKMMNALLKMERLDIAELKRAYER